VAERLPIPGCSTGSYYAATTPRDVLAVARALAAHAVATDEDEAMLVVREFIASCFRVDLYAEAWARVAAAAAPAFDPRGTLIFMLPGSRAV
jgi:hypothetical protein